ncbi:uracil-DNA glycosylase family protein [Acidovorax sp. 106]|uniref:uracil-DNA glycosylase family protein n=1 Tax=Acidovorax sp. 106 TaxID=2135637 RepID=UPI000EAC9405|nr:uracil-DNA glycosylase family protein [Acidovorax sp. 106]RLJ37510.1 DNA polymerase [Acidovorax sp. 106]
MSLNLDARQRAMLQEMGVTVWARAEAATPVPVVPLPPTAAASTAQPPAQPSSATTHPPAQHPPAQRPEATATPAARAPSAAPSRPAPAAAPAAASGLGTPATAAPALRLHAPQPLYPTADPAQTPSTLGASWLIVTEGVSATEPLGGDTGKLLDNMLRAMQLHRHPRVFLAALARPTPGARAAEDDAPTDVAQALEQAVHTLQPAMVLVLGHVAARAALGRTEPLGRLRAVPHTVGGRPAVVTYDPAFLLRSQDAKAATWADLCRALALVRKG